jgi:hypothetical protein
MAEHENYERLKALLIAHKDRVVPERERQEQAMSFNYGNLSLSTNHKPSRKAFVELAQSHYGWSVEDAEAWAATKTWERE